ncbi:hypothetical protein LCL95_04580 [Bacillus timonensis]|nr:hypothetical protein [Bacillus timonensis]
MILFIGSCFYFFSPSFSSHKISLIAHRGATLLAPENTISAFDKAVELGFEYIEFDVHLSKDHHLVVIHDTTIDRTTNGKGYVKDHTLEELKQLDAGGWFSPKFINEEIPTLEEILLRYHDKIGILIDIKNPLLYPDIEEELISLLKNLRLANKDKNNIMIQSFNHRTIEKINSIAPNEYKTGIIFNQKLNYRHLIQIPSDIDFISVNHFYLNRKLVHYSKLLQLEVFAWGSFTIERIDELILYGINGIITNKPKILS